MNEWMNECVMTGRDFVDCVVVAATGVTRRRLLLFLLLLLSSSLLLLLLPSSSLPICFSSQTTLQKDSHSGTYHNANRGSTGELVDLVALAQVLPSFTPNTEYSAAWTPTPTGK